MKKFYIILVLLILSITVFANPVSVQKATQIGQSFFSTDNTTGLLKTQTKDTPVLIRVLYNSNVSQATPFYIFNRSTGGFVIVAGDDVVSPILAYSETQSFDEAEIPVNVRWWLESYSRQIEFARENNLTASAETQQAWNNFITENMQKAPASTDAVAPLMTTTWNQLPYYNKFCPNSDPTGCVATAMAQIMKYHNFPAQGMGNASYYHQVYGIISANFDVNYNWAQMPNALTIYSTTAQIDAVATLMFHCGVASSMNYAPQGSGAYSICAALALINYFGYDFNIQLYSRDYDGFTTTTWTNLVKSELDASRPIYYAGSDGQAGHAFVCDGYNTSNYFHFNWGWGGYYDGYFLLDALNPDYQGTGGNEGGFNYGQEIITNIKPAQAGNTVALACPSIQTNNLIPNETGNFSVTLKNTGTANYNSYIVLRIFDYWDNYQDITSDIENINSGQTVVLNFSQTIYLPSGMYDLVLFCDNNNNMYDPEFAYLQYIRGIYIGNLSGIDDLQNNQISIYPNPVKDELHIIFNEQLPTNNVEICDITGKKILDTQYLTLGNNSINVSALLPGMYIIKIGNHTSKFIKK